jgi:hypothetical protein
MGYQTAFNSMQHVVFFTDDGHIHELYHDGAWHRRDLTNLAAAPLAVVSDDMAGLFDAYVATFNNQRHIIFSGRENHVHELYHDGAWHHKDLTALAGAPSLNSESALVGYQTAFNNQQHVIFSVGVASKLPGTAAHVHELYHDGAWHHKDLTASVGAPNTDVSDSLDGYVTSFNNQQHVNYFDGNGHIHELYRDNAWHHNDLTALSGAPTAVGGSSLIGYRTAFNKQQHVLFEVYTGTELHIYELYYTPQ